MDELIAPKGRREVARRRQIGMWLSKKHTDRSLTFIARRFGKSDHTTVLHAVKRIRSLSRTDPDIRRDVLALYRRVQEMKRAGT